MEGESTFKWAVGLIGAALISLYGLFIHHVRKHVEPDDIAKLKENVQYKDTCTEVVKRLDEKFDKLDKKLDVILGHVKK